MSEKQIVFGEDTALRQAAALYRQGRKHALKDESVDGINCMVKAISMLEPMKGEDHRILRGECLYFIGMMEIWRGRYGTAHDMLSEATKLNPKTAIYWAFLAQACQNLGCDHKAKEAAETAAALPNSNVILHMLASLWEHYNEPEKAKGFADLASLASKDNPDACYLLGNSNYIKGDKNEAQKWYGRAIELQPDHADANHGYGMILSEQRKFRESIPYFEKGIKSAVSGPNSLWGKALAHLTLGEFEQGFKEHEIRSVFLKQEFGHAVVEKRMDKPQWHGQKEPSRIHVYSEQGFGDCLQFCRYIHLLRDMGHHVTFEVDTSMLELMSYNFPGVNIVPLASDYPGTVGIPEVDYRIALGSLPYAFGTTIDTIPSAYFYLCADPGKAITFAQKIGNQRPRVGLCWAGGKRVQDPKLVAMDEKRSINFSHLAPLFEVENINFVSLQTGLAAEQNEFLADPMKDVKSWADTAAVIANLDLVISVDTSVLHLAAAMGKPTWLLNKYHTCWRWMLDREDTPWYQSMRIFRPLKEDAWDEVIAQAREALCQL